MQAALSRHGYQPGPIDGVFGPSTRSALSAFQRDRGLVADGYPDPDSLQMVLE